MRNIKFKLTNKIYKVMMITEKLFKFDNVVIDFDPEYMEFVKN